jgi:GntR family transcriptional regulator/GntR family frlABCD operon transcriptional regulator
LLKIKRNSPILYVKRKLKTNIKDVNIYSWLSCDTQDYYLEDYF